MVGCTFQGFGELRCRKNLIRIDGAGIAYTCIIGKDGICEGFYMGETPDILVKYITVFFQFTGRELLHIGDPWTIIGLNGPVTMAPVCAHNAVLIIELDLENTGFMNHDIVKEGLFFAVLNAVVCDDSFPPW